MLAERGQRVAVAQEALVELGARAAQRGPGVAEERALEVVDDGDRADIRRRGYRRDPSGS